MKKLLSTTALLAIFGLSPFFAARIFADTTTTTPVQHYNQAVASWKPVSGIKCYNIYYGWVDRKTKPSWKHSVRCVSNNLVQYTIGFLKTDRSYEYTVAAVKYSGAEYPPTPVSPLVASPMAQ